MRAAVALVGPELEENLGLRYLASSLTAAGVDSVILPFDRSGQLAPVLDAILGSSPVPEVVALCLAFQWRALDVLALAVALRERGYRGHITVGGHFATFTAREILRDFGEIDSVCRHETEETLVALVLAVRDHTPLGDLAGLALRDANGEPFETPVRPAPELATLPWPDRRGEPATCLGHPIAAIVGSRGCYAHCAFCCISAFHEAAHPGERFRLRPVSDVADEMVWLSKKHGRDIFIFHDDNFFVPGARASLERIDALADALGARAMGRFAVVVKARPTDVTPEVFEALIDRLHCVRVFLGIETDAVQGLKTLARRVTPRRNHEAMAILRELGLYVCYNLLLFDPDTDLESLATNVRFMEEHGDSPSNFGRVELYAGTPLLARLQAEGRATGDWVGWDYALATPAMERIFRLAVHCFYPRNFGPGALANRLQGTRFDVEIARAFHPERFRPEWLDEAKRLSRTLATDSAKALREITARVQAGRADEPDVADLCAALRRTEHDLATAASALEAEVQRAVAAICVHQKPSPLDRMRRIVTATAVAGTVFQACGCDKNGGPPMVCDPLPPPIDCAQHFTTRELINTYGFVSYTATWHQDGASWLVRMTFDLYANHLALAGDPTFVNGTLASLDAASRTATHLELSWLPDASLTATVAVPLTCDGTSMSLNFRHTPDGTTPTEGGSPPIAPID